MDVEVFLGSEFAKYLSSSPFGSIAEALIEDFRQYKRTGRLPDYFGCDQPYLNPPVCLSAKLQHIHLAVPPYEFPQRKPQRDRKCPQGAPERDAALVYVQGSFERDRYCLMGILYPNAHALAQVDAVIGSMAWEAKDWRDNN